MRKVAARWIAQSGRTSNPHQHRCCKVNVTHMHARMLCSSMVCSLCSMHICRVNFIVIDACLLLLSTTTASNLPG